MLNNNVTIGKENTNLSANKFGKRAKIGLFTEDLLRHKTIIVRRSPQSGRLLAGVISLAPGGGNIGMCQIWVFHSPLFRLCPSFGRLDVGLYRHKIILD